MCFDALSNCLTSFNNLIRRIINSLPNVKLCGQFDTSKTCVIITFSAVLIGIVDLFVQLIRYLIQNEKQANPIGYNFPNAFVFILVFVGTVLWVVFTLAVFFAVYLSNKPKKETISDLSIRQFLLCSIFYVFVSLIELIITFVDFASFGSAISLFWGLLWIFIKIGLSIYSTLVVLTCFRAFQKLVEEKPEEKPEDVGKRPSEEVSIYIPLKEDLPPEEEDDDKDNNELAKNIIHDLIRKIISSAQEDNLDNEKKSPQIIPEEGPSEKPQATEKSPQENPVELPTKKSSSRKKAWENCTTV